MLSGYKTIIVAIGMLGIAAALTGALWTKAIGIEEYKAGLMAVAGFGGPLLALTIRDAVARK